MNALAIARPLVMLVRLTGLLAVLLGVLIWVGMGAALVSIHMLVGIVFVVCLGVLGGLGATAGARAGSSLGAVALALVVLVVGLSQGGWLPGANHWIVQVSHLVLGVAAIGVGEMVGAALKRAARPGAV